ncbi:ketoacyl-ACP synthase III family protein [Streptacidiphilus sp. EB103A]|jgi:3-oxoacyl-[acyl-carrier-protein] synthase-3|uniref:ketoacyl-ACP synthase III family protein n=1 Tax=Streptacidiphilus sp. EB103A TaxID=3156275 RepID=UPI0035122698
MKTDGIYIDTVGVHLPDEWVSIEKAVAEGLYDEMSIAYGTGLTAAYIAGDVPAVDMAVDAARQAIERSEQDTGSIDFHVHCSATQQGPAGSYPGGYVLRELGISGIPSTDVRQHSNGMLAAFEVVVGQMTGAAAAESVLVTAGENFTTPKIDRWQGFGTGFTASDGAAAVLFSAESGFAQLRSLNSGTLPALEQWHRGEQSQLAYRDDELGQVTMLDLLTFFNANVIPLDKCMQMIMEFELDIVQRSLVDAELNASDIACVVVANSDATMIDQMKMQPLGLPMSRSSWDFGKEFGHIGACDMAVLLNHMITTGRLAVGDNILMTTSGAGWVSSSAVLTILDVPAWAC